MNNLKALIQSLSASEIRAFKHHTTRSGRENPRYTVLFDLLHRKKDVAIEKEFPKERSRSVLANDLFEHLLESLEKDIKSPQQQIRKLLNDAEQLYNRGLPKDALKRLYAAREIVKSGELFGYHIEILNWLPRLEPSKADAHATEYDQVCASMLSYRAYYKLHLQFRDFIKRQENCKTEKDKAYLTALLQHELLTKPAENLCLLAQLDFIRCHVIYARMCFLNVENLTWCRKAVAIFDQNPLFKAAHPNLYTASLLTLQFAFFNQNDPFVQENLREEYLTLTKYLTELPLVKPIAAQVFSYLFPSRLRQIQHFYADNPTEKYAQVAELQKQYLYLKDHIPHEGHQIYHANFVNFHFADQKYFEAEQAIENLIEHAPLRPDIAAFARIWHLIVHYELSNKQALLNQAMSVYQYLRRHELLYETEKTLLLFFERLSNLDAHQAQEKYILLQNLQRDLEVHWQQAYEASFYARNNLVVWIEQQLAHFLVVSLLETKTSKSIT